MMRLAQQSLARMPLNPPPPPPPPNLPVFYPGSIFKMLYVDSDWSYLWPDRKRGCLGYRGYCGFFSPTFINPCFRYSPIVNIENLDFKNPRFSNICLKLGFQKSEVFKHLCFRYSPTVNIENMDV